MQKKMFKLLMNVIKRQKIINNFKDEISLFRLFTICPIPMVAIFELIWLPWCLIKRSKLKLFLKTFCLKASSRLPSFACTVVEFNRKQIKANWSHRLKIHVRGCIWVKYQSFESSESEVIFLNDLDAQNSFIHSQKSWSSRTILI